MNEIITLLKQVGIFMVCAQTIVHFKPQQKYDKYLKLLIGIMVMVQLVTPVFDFLNGGEKFNIEAALPKVWQGTSFDIDGMLGEADQIVDKYTENEIKSRLNNEEINRKDTRSDEKIGTEETAAVGVEDEVVVSDRIEVEDIVIDKISVGDAISDDTGRAVK